MSFTPAVNVDLLAKKRISQTGRVIMGLVQLFAIFVVAAMTSSKSIADDIAASTNAIALGAPTQEELLSEREGLVYAKDLSAIVRLGEIRNSIQHDPNANIAALLNEASGLLRNPPAQLTTPTDFSQLWPLLRLDDNQLNLLAWMNLQSLKAAILNKDQNLRKLLTDDQYLIQSSLRLDAAQGADTALIVQKIDQIEPFITLLLHGFNPDRGPSVRQAARYLQMAGLPDVPFQITKPSKTKDGRSWAVDVSLDLGLGQPQIISNQIVGSAYGFMYLPDQVPFDLSGLFASMQRKQLSVFLGKNTVGTINRMWISNGQLTADLFLKLGDTGFSFILTGVVAHRTADGKLSWALENSVTDQLNALAQVEIGSLTIAELHSRVTKEKVEFQSLVELKSLGLPNKEITDAIDHLRNDIVVSPGDWLAHVGLGSNALNSDSKQICAQTFKAIFTVGNDRIVIAPIGLTKKGVVSIPEISNISVVRTNIEVLRDVIRKLPFGIESKSSEEVSIDNVKLDADAGYLELQIRRVSPMFDEPLPIDLRIPLKEGQAINWNGALRKSLSGKRLHMGSMATVTLASDLEGKADWPATIETAGQKLRVVVDWNCQDAGKLSIVPSNPQFRDAFTDLFANQEKELKEAFAGLIHPEIASVHFSKSEAGHNASLEVSTDLQAGISVTAKIDDTGIHVVGQQDALAAVLKRQFPDDWPVKILRMQFLDGGYQVDADLTWNGTTVFGVENARFSRGQWQSLGVVHCDPTISHRISDSFTFGGPDLALNVDNLRLDSQMHPIADFGFNLIGWGPIWIRDVSLTRMPTNEDLEKLLWVEIARKCGSDGWTAQYGSVTATLKADNSGPQARFQVHASWPAKHLELDFDTVKLDSSGFQLGPATFDDQAAKKWAKAALSETQIAICKELSGLDTADVNVQLSAPVVTGETLRDLGITFDMSVTVKGQPFTIRGNRLDETGIHFGKMPDLRGIAITQVGRRLDQFTDWVPNKTVEFGPSVRMTVVSSDAHTQTVVADLQLIGGSAGKVQLVFASGQAPQITFAEPPSVVARLRQIESSLPMSSVADAIQIQHVDLTSNGLQFDLGIALPPLPKPVPLAHVTLASAVSIRAAAGGNSWEEQFWSLVASKVKGSKWTSNDLPFGFDLSDARAVEHGVLCSAQITIQELDPIIVHDLRIAADGIHFDRQSLLESVASSAMKRFQTAMPDGPVVVKSVKSDGRAITINMDIALGSDTTIPLSILIDQNGVHRPNLQAVLKIGLQKLADSIAGKKISLPGGAELTVGDHPSVADDLSGVFLDGEVKIYEPFGLKASNILFKGKSFDLSKAKWEATGLANILSDVGIGNPAGNVKCDPTFGPEGLTGADLQVPISVADLFTASLNITITRNGFSVVLPFKLVLPNLIITIPPIKLSNANAEIGRDHISVGCLVSPIPPEAEHLIALDGTTRFPLTKPWIIRSDGNLQLIGFVPLGHTDAILDIEKKVFSTELQMGFHGTITIDGSLEMNANEVALHMKGNAEAFGANIAKAYLVIDRDKFHADARVTLLLAEASASFGGRWDAWQDTSLDTNVKFHLPLPWCDVTVAGADVQATLRPSAQFKATILGLDITLLSVDLHGITLDRIAALFLNDHILPTGFKLLAPDEGGGGGGGVTVTPSGAVGRVLKDGTIQLIYKDRTGHISMGSIAPSGAGGGGDITVVRVWQGTKTVIPSGPDGDQHQKDQDLPGPASPKVSADRPPFVPVERPPQFVPSAN